MDPASLTSARTDFHDEQVISIVNDAREDSAVEDVCDSKSIPQLPIMMFNAKTDDMSDIVVMSENLVAIHMVILCQDESWLLRVLCFASGG